MQSSYSTFWRSQKWNCLRLQRTLAVINSYCRTLSLKLVYTFYTNSCNIDCLLYQGLFQLLETQVSIRCRKQDVNLVKVQYNSIPNKKRTTHTMYSLTHYNSTLIVYSSAGWLWSSLPISKTKNRTGLQDSVRYRISSIRFVSEKKKKRGSDRIRTGDLLFTRQAL